MENDLDPLNLMPKLTPNRPLLGLKILIIKLTSFYEYQRYHQNWSDLFGDK